MVRRARKEESMSEPKIAKKKPAVLELEPGESYWWCACGRSANQPFCDGSHAGTGFEPVEFRVDRKKNYALCQCKHTGDAPWCDGTHGKL
jgi:CDGSH-type Zn-finger protein